MFDLNLVELGLKIRVSRVRFRSQHDIFPLVRLRRFILDLAVRGKRVPQNPSDEPASDLLKRIAKAASVSGTTGKEMEAHGTSYIAHPWPTIMQRGCCHRKGR